MMTFNQTNYGGTNQQNNVIGSDRRGMSILQIQNSGFGSQKVAKATLKFTNLRQQAKDILTDSEDSGERAIALFHVCLVQHLSQYLGVEMTVLNKTDVMDMKLVARIDLEESAGFDPDVDFSVYGETLPFKYSGTENGYDYFSMRIGDYAENYLGFVLSIFFHAQNNYVASRVAIGLTTSAGFNLQRYWDGMGCYYTRAIAKEAAKSDFNGQSASLIRAAARDMGFAARALIQGWGCKYPDDAEIDAYAQKHANSFLYGLSDQDEEEPCDQKGDGPWEH